jgi:uncharacterized protein YdbL (DUF1318 family)
MLKGQQAVPPVATWTVADFINKVKDASYEEVVKKAEKEDEEVLNLLGNKSFEKFKELVEKRIEFLKNLVDPESKTSLVDINDTPDRIGMKYLIISFAIYQLRQMINLPETINEAKKAGGKIGELGND